MKKGKFIVIDGTDGSGKATQVKLLAERLKKEGKKVEIVDFFRKVHRTLSLRAVLQLAQSPSEDCFCGICCGSF